jgi:hypothetical protein|tara:strand:+ start:304 stop:456 length:153 start_codon:yes stop_codon:yes gene_type:complete
MNTIKYTNFNSTNQPQTIILTKNNKKEYYNRIPYAKEYTKYITINGISYA